MTKILPVEMLRIEGFEFVNGLRHVMLAISDRGRLEDSLQKQVYALGVPVVYLGAPLYAYNAKSHDVVRLQDVFYPSVSAEGPMVAPVSIMPIWQDPGETISHGYLTGKSSRGEVSQIGGDLVRLGAKRAFLGPPSCDWINLGLNFCEVRILRDVYFTT